MPFKCFSCYTIIPDKEILENHVCPICGSVTEEMCPLDHQCTCVREMSEGLRFCSCGKPTCACGSHDVVVISRVTGYLSDVAGWNSAKAQELKDRNRVSV
jgi:hypothetical protein